MMGKNSKLNLLISAASILSSTGTNCSVDGRVLEKLYFNRAGIYHLLERFVDNSDLRNDYIFTETN